MRPDLGNVPDTEMEGQLQYLHLNYLHALQVTSRLLTILPMECCVKRSHHTILFTG